jgi:hypothetical protein
LVVKNGEGMRAGVVVHAAAGVRDPQKDVFTRRRLGPTVRLAFDEPDPLRFEGEDSAAGHRVACVHGEVDQDLLDLAAVGVDRANLWCERAENVDVLAQQAPQKGLAISRRRRSGRKRRAAGLSRSISPPSRTTSLPSTALVSSTN